MSDTLSRLQAANPALRLLDISAPEFVRYGRLLTRYDPAEMIARARAILPRSHRVIYEASVKALEADSSLNRAMLREVYGGMPVQVGWCFGENLQLAALEYHKGSEVNICLTGAILLVGSVQDIVYGEEIRYDTSKVAAFYAPEGSVVELAPWNLHFAPINVQQGQQFATLVYLPRNTNLDLPFEVPQVGENRLLFAINKWLLAHPDVEALIHQGAYPGLQGSDIFVKPI